MYVAGFDLGVLPMGDWSISMTLSIASYPLTPFCLACPVFRLIELLLQERIEGIHNKGTLTRTRNTGYGGKYSKGYLPSICFKLWALAPLMVRKPFVAFLFSGILISRLFDR